MSSLDSNEIEFVDENEDSGSVEDIEPYWHEHNKLKTNDRRVNHAQPNHNSQKTRNYKNTSSTTLSPEARKILDSSGKNFDKQWRDL